MSQFLSFKGCAHLKTFRFIAQFNISSTKNPLFIKKQDFLFIYLHFSLVMNRPLTAKILVSQAKFSLNYEKL